jgi:hypothetical protein
VIILARNNSIALNSFVLWLGSTSISILCISISIFILHFGHFPSGEGFTAVMFFFGAAFSNFIIALAFEALIFLICRRRTMGVRLAFMPSLAIGAMFGFVFSIANSLQLWAAGKKPPLAHMDLLKRGIDCGDAIVLALAAVLYVRAVTRRVGGGFDVVMEAGKIDVHL